MRYNIRCLLGIALLLPSLSIGQSNTSIVSKPPTTPSREVTDTYFGTRIIDPYRWLEDLKSPEVSAWMKGQNDFTRTVLDRIPGRDQLRARISQLDNTGVVVNDLQSFGGRWFYLKRTPGDDNRKLYVREGPTGVERLLLNPETLTSNGVHYSIDYYQASPDGKLAAVGISPGGSENSVLHVLDAGSGRDLGEHIDRTQFGSVFWLPDNRSFFYNRLQKLSADAPRTSYYLNSRDYLHHLGADPERDTPIFGNGLSPAVSMAESDFPFVSSPPGSKYVLGVVAHGVQNEITLYLARLDQVRDANVPWHKIADVPDDVTGFDIHGDSLYMVSHHDASHFKVLRIGLPEGEIAKANVTIPASEAVVVGVTAAADALYVQKLDGGLGRLWRLPFDNGALSEVSLPFEGAIQEMVANPAEPGVYLRLASWTRSPLYSHYDPNINALADTKIIPVSPVDFSGIESEEVKAKAPDGTLVPLSIVHKRVSAPVAIHELIGPDH